MVAVVVVVAAVAVSTTDPRSWSLVHHRDNTIDIVAAVRTIVALAKVDTRFPSIGLADRTTSIVGPFPAAIDRTTVARDVPEGEAGEPPDPSLLASCPTLPASLATCTSRNPDRSTCPILVPPEPYVSRGGRKRACYYYTAREREKKKKRCLPGRLGSPRSLSPRNWASDRLGCLASCGTGALRRCFRYSLQPRKLMNEESREGIKLVAVRSASTKLDLNSGFEQP